MLGGRTVSAHRADEATIRHPTIGKTTRSRIFIGITTALSVKGAVGREPQVLTANRSQLLLYTGIAAPLIAREASEARNRITSAMASGATQLLKSAFGRAARFCGVSIVEGSTQFTLTFDALSSSASDSLSRRTALLDAL